MTALTRGLRLTGLLAGLLALAATAPCVAAAGRVCVASPAAPEARLRVGALRAEGPAPEAPPEWRAPDSARLRLVLLAGMSREGWRERLEQAGAEILRAVPPAGHIVRLRDGTGSDALLALDFVLRVEPFHPWYRLDASLRERLADAGGLGPPGRVGPLDRPGPGDALELRLVAAGWGRAARAGLAAEVVALGGEVINDPPSGRVLEVRLAAAQLRELATRDELLWVDLRTAAGTDMDLVRPDSGRTWLEGQSGDCGQGVRGEVFDSGFEETHQDFDGVMLHGPHDLMSHGTSTYGIVFGNGARDGDGDSRGEGLLSCAEQGIFADNGEVTDRFAHTQELLAHPYYASFQTNSWGHSRTTSYTSYSQEMDDIVWQLDLAITQSQSNSGTQESRPEAWAKNVISVGAVRHGNSPETSDDFWGGFASIGPAEDGRIKPDVCYWGDNIYTTTNLDGYRPDFNGTSAATPQVAGVLGLQLQMWSENVWNTNPAGATVFERRPHAATSKALLINSARQYPFSGTADDLTRTHQGWGRPSARVARERAARSLVVDEATALQLGGTARYDVEVLAGEPELRATLVYTDPPGTLSAAMHRINDLDLTLHAPSGAVYHGNYGLDTGTESQPGGSADTLNTVENVFLLYPEPGHWQVEVSASEINQDQHLETPEADADFALVVTGAAGSAVCDPGAPATALAATPGADNEVQLDWTAAADAVEYRVYRSRDGCGQGYEQLGVTAGTSFLDAAASGGVESFYVVRAVNSCGGVAADSNCASAIPTGPCLDPPLFDGLTRAKDLGQSTCSLELRWNAAAPRCGSQVRYNVYRSTDAAFVPDPSTLIASCLDATSYTDTSIADGVRQHYLVRAEDIGAAGDGACSGGVQDGNLVRREGTASGPDEILFGDDFETSTGWTLEGEWQIDAPQGLGGSLIGGPDPAVAYQGTKVLGDDLTGLGAKIGQYEPLADERATSPVFDASAHAQVRLRFWRWLGTETSDSDLATIEVSSGGAWSEVWRNPQITLSDRNWAYEEYDLTPWLAGASSAQLRFSQVASFNRHLCGWNIDSLEVFEPTACSAASVPPSPVADGRFVPGAPMLASRASGGGDKVDLSWDVSGCSSASYDLFYGDSADLPSYVYAGARCDLSPTGSDSVNIPAPAPGHFTWWLLAGIETTTESSHGHRSDGSQRPATGVGQCGLTTQDTSGGCP